MELKALLSSIAESDRGDNSYLNIYSYCFDNDK